MPTLSSLVAPQVVTATNDSATSDDKVDITTTLSFSLQACVKLHLSLEQS